MILGVPNYGAFVVGVVLIVLLPGPNSMFVLATGARDGVAAGYRATAGVFLGDTTLMLLSVAGAAGLLRSVPLAFMVIKYLGGGYLTWLGIGLLRAGWARFRRPAETADDAGTIPARRPFLTATALSLLNPKAILFFIAFFVQFVDPADPSPVRTFLVLGGTMQLISLAYLSVLILAGRRLSERFRRHRRASAGATSGVGLIFLGFGVKLATASLR